MRRMRRRSSVSSPPHGGRREPFGHQAADAGVARVVHHVQHDAGHGEVLDDGPPVGAVPSGLRRIGDGVAEDLEHLVVGGHRPETLPVGRVRRGFVPPHRGGGAVQAEDLVRETPGKGVQVGEVDLPHVLDHRPILVAVPIPVKNGGRGV